MSTLVEFRSRFPQMVGVPDQNIQTAINDAILMWDPALPNWSAIVCYQAAHQIEMQAIAMAEQADRARGLSADTPQSSKTSSSSLNAVATVVASTRYSQEVARLVAPYAGGGFGLV